jgi:hypothetical protein
LNVPIGSTTAALATLSKSNLQVNNSNTTFADQSPFTTSIRQVRRQLIGECHFVLRDLLTKLHSFISTTRSSIATVRMNLGLPREFNTDSVGSGLSQLNDRAPHRGTLVCSHARVFSDASLSSCALYRNDEHALSELALRVKYAPNSNVSEQLKLQ